MSLERENYHRQVIVQGKENFHHRVKNQGQENYHHQVRGRNSENFLRQVRSQKENCHLQVKDQFRKVERESNPPLQIVQESVTTHHQWKYLLNKHLYLENSLPIDLLHQPGEDPILQIPLRINHGED